VSFGKRQTARLPKELVKCGCDSVTSTFYFYR